MLRANFTINMRYCKRNNSPRDQKFRSRTPQLLRIVVTGRRLSVFVAVSPRGDRTINCLPHAPLCCALRLLFPWCLIVTSGRLKSGVFPVQSNEIGDTESPVLLPGAGVGYDLYR
jgi:hypothetical protein